MQRKFTGFAIVYSSEVRHIGAYNLHKILSHERVMRLCVVFPPNPYRFSHHLVLLGTSASTSLLTAIVTVALSNITPRTTVHVDRCNRSTWRFIDLYTKANLLSMANSDSRVAQRPETSALLDERGMCFSVTHSSEDDSCCSNHSI